MNMADGFDAVQRSEPATGLDNVCVTEHEFVMPGTGVAARTGVLLVHGLTGTPAEMRLLAKGLNKQGFTVYAVQLAGHCGSMEDQPARWDGLLLPFAPADLAALLGDVAANRRPRAPSPWPRHA